METNVFLQMTNYAQIRTRSPRTQTKPVNFQMYFQQQWAQIGNNDLGTLNIMWQIAKNSKSQNGNKKSGTLNLRWISNMEQETCIEHWVPDLKQQAKKICIQDIKQGAWNSDSQTWKEPEKWAKNSDSQTRNNEMLCLTDRCPVH